MSILAIILVLGLVALVGYVIYLNVSTPRSSDSIIIIGDSQSGKSEVKNSVGIPLSENQPEGIVFSYSGWVLVNDFTSLGYGTKRRIFSKGDCPGLYIDSTSNSFLVVVNTYGATESILIPSIPAKKWIHFAIVVNQYSVEIYINGTLRMYHTLNQLPKQNSDSVITGSNYDGMIGKLNYYPRSLSNAEIDKQSKETPPSDGYVGPASPQYLDISWYIGRLNSS